ncbi:MAG TPA: amino acid racemase, partial [Hyphomonadaceae bacterium]|nr:amino acid racemase [Hyphomonadaceae bacterium]
FALIEQMQRENRWKEAGAALANAAQSLERAGAQVIAIGANTMHKVAHQVMAATQLPLIHIGDALVAGLRRDARSKPLLLGTRYTLEDPSILRDHLATKGIEAVVPGEADRHGLHAIIFNELIHGIVTDASRQRVREMIAEGDAQEADSVIFGCTEIGMLFPPSDAGLPGYDTLALHAEALVDFALN